MSDKAILVAAGGLVAGGLMLWMVLEPSKPEPVPQVAGAVVKAEAKAENGTVAVQSTATPAPSPPASSQTAREEEIAPPPSFTDESEVPAEPPGI